MSDAFTDLMAAVSEAHRFGDLKGRLDDLLVDGRLLLTEPALEALKREAAVTPEDAAASLPAWALISVLAIPDDGEPHDIGNGKVAIVSPIDHRTIIVAPADLLNPPPPKPLRLTEEARDIRRPGSLP